MDIDEHLRARDGCDDRMTTLIHPVAVILDILAEVGVDPARLHDVQRRIAAAYSEANEEIAPTPTREREIREAVLATIREACRCDPYWRDRDRDDPQCQAHGIEDYVEQALDRLGVGNSTGEAPKEAK